MMLFELVNACTSAGFGPNDEVTIDTPTDSYGVVDVRNIDGRLTIVTTDNTTI